MLKSIKNTTILATAITVVAVTLMTPTIFPTAASAQTVRDKACGDTQFEFVEPFSAITIDTSQDQYRVEIDYYQDTGGFDETPFHKSIAAEEPSNVLLPGGETVTITVRSNDDLSSAVPNVSLYSSKVSDCEILFGTAKAKDKIALEVVDVQLIEGSIWELTVLVPDATDISKRFTKLAVGFSSSSESNDLYIISGGVQAA